MWKLTASDSMGNQVEQYHERLSAATLAADSLMVEGFEEIDIRPA